MCYFVFDLDETLAELHSVFYFVQSLTMNKTIKEDTVYLRPFLPYSFDRQLTKAYHLFVERVLEMELSDTPLGILRPGILSVMKQLDKLKTAQKIKGVVIYSNNGLLPCLEFIRDLIHRYLEHSLIDDCIHLNHVLRRRETFKDVHYEKTWAMLYSILVDGKTCAPATIVPEDVFFFDDIDHSDLHSHLQDHYYKVPKYKFRASFARIMEIYQNAITEVSLDVKIIMMCMFDLFGIKNPIIRLTPMNEILMLFRFMVRKTADAHELPRPADRGITMMMDAIQRVKRGMYKTTQKQRTHPKRNGTLKIKK
jgi:hypothetical protein